MHHDIKNSDLPVFCMISSLGSRVVCFEKFPYIFHWLIIVGCMGHSDGGYDIKALTCSFICIVLLIKMLKNVFYNGHHDGEICCQQGNSCAGDITSRHLLFFLMLLSKSPQTVPTV